MLFRTRFLRCRDGNIHPKIREAVITPHGQSRVQMIAYALIVAFFLVAMLYVYIVERCESVEALRRTATAKEDGSYKLVMCQKSVA